MKKGEKHGCLWWVLAMILVCLVLGSFKAIFSDTDDEQTSATTVTSIAMTEITATTTTTKATTVQTTTAKQSTTTTKQTTTSKTKDAIKTTPIKTETATQTTTTAAQVKEYDYVLNTETHKFHRSSCSKKPTSNAESYHGTRDNLIAKGYTPCQICNP